MPHATEYATSVIPDTVDYWDDPRSITAFQTFPRAGGSPDERPSSTMSQRDGPQGEKGNNSNGETHTCLTPPPTPQLLEESLSINGHVNPENGHEEMSTCSEDQEKGEEEDEDVFDLTITLDLGDRRFGFSAIGGCDEGFSPRIEEVTPGSPADRADLEVGDEILEVNGKSLDNCTHTEVISHIHQCIRSRTICLRVKRKTSSKLALDLAQNSNVQDAFVIAVEQQARERLEKLSALKKIKPVDMTKLSQELNECPLSTPELNGVIENNPIYVTSVPEIQNATLERIKTSREHLGELAEGATSENLISSANGLSKSQFLEQDSHDQELELIQDIIEGKDIILPVPSGASTLPCEQKSDDQIKESVPKTTVVHNHVEKGKDTKIKQTDFVKDDSCKSLKYTNKTSVVMELENGQHREMAVDVPDSFVAITKTPPRYPPLKSGGIPHDSLPRKRGEPPEPPVRSTTPLERPVVQTTLDSKSKTVSETENTLATFHSRTDDTESDNISRTQKPSVVEVNGVPPDVLPTMTVNEEQLERIRKYQEDIRKRREEEERQALEDEFLRTSLRRSKKLQALESKPPLPPRRGVVNTAFELEEGDTGTLSAEQNVSPGRLVGDVDACREPVELTKIIDPPELLETLYRLGSHLQGNGHRNEDLELVESILRKTEFQKVLDVHNKVQEIWCFGCPPTPVCCFAQDISQEIITSLQECSLPEAAELLDILSKFEFEGLMYSHDKIGERQALPLVTPDEELLDRASQYTEESVKIVRIDKTNEPLGATVRNEGEAVIIGRIVKGGAAEKCGLLHEGDEILEVNGIEMRGKSVNDVCDILANMTGTLTFLIMPTQYEQKGLPRESVMHVKAHFDYDPDDDLYIPCRELGISFQKGDILHVINQEDPNWWQAYREGEEDQTLAGLIPSKSFQQQREAVKQTIVGEVNNREKSKKGKFLCAKKHHKKKKKKVMYQGNLNEDYDSEQILTYEEVALYYPRANRKRPIVLIGPPNIGRHELRQRLMEDTERFAAAVPHTSRSRRDTEVDGVDYHFITRSQFEADILGGRFVEHGEYEKNYYGTSLDAIRSVVNSGKICVLNLHPQSLKILKYSDLKPYVVFVAPPSLEKLRQNRLKLGATAKDEELKDIIEKAREMEENYGHYFDMVIINSDIDKAYNELLKEINILEREPQWVPSVWLKNEIN